MIDEDKPDEHHIGRRSAIAVGATVAAAGVASVLLPDGGAVAWVKPVIRSAIGAPSAAASQSVESLILAWEPSTATLVGSTPSLARLTIHNPNDHPIEPVQAQLANGGGLIITASANDGWIVASSGPFGQSLQAVSPLPAMQSTTIEVQVSYTNPYDDEPISLALSTTVTAGKPTRYTFGSLQVQYSAPDSGQPKLVGSERPQLRVNGPNWNSPIVGDTFTGIAYPKGSTPIATWVTYQWLRGLDPIDGATDITYQATLDDIGSNLAFVATYHRVGYQSVSLTATSNVPIGKAPIRVITPAQFATTTPGTLQPGTTWTIVPGVYDPMPDEITYFWSRGNYPDSGPVFSNSPSYTFTQADNGWAIEGFLNLKTDRYRDLAELVDRVRVQYDAPE